MVNLDLFHRILTISDSAFSTEIYNVQDIIDEEPIIKSHIVPVMQNENYVYHVNDRSDSSWLSNMFLNLLARLPIQDMNNQWKNEEHAIKGIYDYYGNVIKSDRVNYYNEMSKRMSELSQADFLKLLITEGMAAHLATFDENKSEWIVDLMYMNQYKVRDGLLPYGATLHMTENFEIKFIRLPFCVVNDGKKDKIYDTITAYPQDHKYWQMAYNVFTSSLIAHVTIKNHAVECHFIMAGGMLSAHHDNQYKIGAYLSNLIKPFIFRTGDINSSALGILVNPGGIVSRLFSFTQDSLNKYMHDCFTSYKFCHPLEKYNHRLAFYRDASKLMNIIEKFTKNMLIDIFPLGPFNVTSFIEDINNRIPGIANENISDTDNLVRIISSHIYNVSVWHEQIGNMS